MKVKTHHVKVWTEEQTKELYNAMLEGGYELTTSDGSWSDRDGFFFKFDNYFSGMKKDAYSDLYMLRIQVGLIVALDEMEE